MLPYNRFGIPQIPDRQVVEVAASYDGRNFLCSERVENKSPKGVAYPTHRQSVTTGTTSCSPHIFGMRSPDFFNRLVIPWTVQRAKFDSTHQSRFPAGSSERRNGCACCQGVAESKFRTNAAENTLRGINTSAATRLQKRSISLPDSSVSYCGEQIPF
jgi:hypothetical protein